jgi:membrane protein YqaA with SNARE-associated domain
MTCARAISTDDVSSLDKFAMSRLALALAFAWGLAEATFFFLVPDVLLTLIGCRSLRPAIKATLASLAGALLGGAVMHAFGRVAIDEARIFLDHIPAIDTSLTGEVARQIDERGLIAVMLGPLRGIPYKIYAVECGARGESLITFLLVSIPARYIRFLLATIAAHVVARMIEPLTRRRARIEVMIWAVAWAAFYSFYFSRFGW